LRQCDEVEVVGLVTAPNEAFGRLAMHEVRAELVHAWADSTGLPLWPVPLPWHFSNDAYKARTQADVGMAQSAGVNAFAFGDLFLEDLTPVVDPCWERGEFHACLVFETLIRMKAGAVVERDRLWLANLIPGERGSQ